MTLGATKLEGGLCNPMELGAVRECRQRQVVCYGAGGVARLEIGFGGGKNIFSYPTSSLAGVVEKDLC